VTYASNPVLAESMLGALGTLGRIDGVSQLLDFMGDESLARGAGAAFTRITGIALREREAGPMSPETEEAIFHDVRPVPDAAAARVAWRERAREFDAQSRWRNGRRIATDDWKNAPHQGDLLTRREELTRLWVREPALFPDLELNAPAVRQRAAA
jgi:hypothetical protein